MIRSRNALFISFAMHTSIAVLALMLFLQTGKEMPALEKKVCLSLTHYIKPLPVVLKPEPVREKPKQKPEVSRQKPKPEPKVVKKAEPVKPEPVPAPEIVKSEPAVEPVEVVEERIEPIEEVAQPAVAEIETPVTQEAVSVAEAVESLPYQAPDTAPVPAPSAEEAYLQKHLAIIAKLLQENLYYPRIARKRGITGEVIVAFKLLANGEVTQIDVKSGEKSILNRAAIETIERLSGRFPKPGTPITLNVPISYRLQ